MVRDVSDSHSMHGLGTDYSANSKSRHEVKTSTQKRLGGHDISQENVVNLPSKEKVSLVQQSAFKNESPTASRSKGFLRLKEVGSMPPKPTKSTTVVGNREFMIKSKGSNNLRHYASTPSTSSPLHKDTLVHFKSSPAAFSNSESIEKSKLQKTEKREKVTQAYANDFTRLSTNGISAVDIDHIKKAKAPEEFSTLFDSMQKTIRADILGMDKEMPPARNKVIAKIDFYCDVAKKCLERGDVNSATTIMSALKGPDITRFKPQLSSKITTKLENLEKGLKEFHPNKNNPNVKVPYPGDYTMASFKAQEFSKDQELVDKICNDFVSIKTESEKLKNELGDFSETPLSEKMNTYREITNLESKFTMLSEKITGVENDIMKLDLKIENLLENKGSEEEIKKLENQVKLKEQEVEPMEKERGDLKKQIKDHPHNSDKFNELSKAIHETKKGGFPFRK